MLIKKKKNNERGFKRGGVDGDAVDAEVGEGAEGVVKEEYGSRL